MDAQGRAIDQLREGAKKLVDEMAQQQGNRRRMGLSQGSDAPGDDPLGRPRRNDGPQDSNSVKVPDEIDTQRAPPGVGRHPPPPVGADAPPA